MARGPRVPRVPRGQGVPRGPGVEREAAVTYGVDVGGTKMLGIALDPDGAVLSERRMPTPHPGGEGDAGTPTAIADAIGALVAGLEDEVGASGRATRPGVHAAPSVGLGLAALVDRRGAARFSPHLRGIERGSRALGTLVAARLGGAQVACWNDANCVALAELGEGALRGARDALVVVLGTGIGGALVVNGVIARGANGFAGEIGHMVVSPGGRECPCGGRGCWERYVSGGAFARLGLEESRAGRVPGAVRRAGGDPESVEGGHVAAAAMSGDRGALEVVEEMARWLAVGLSTLVAVLDPERVVVGGPLAGLDELLLGPARRTLSELVVGGDERAEVRLMTSELGERAGAVGAALLARGVES